MITLLYITQTLMSRYNYNIDYIICRFTIDVLHSGIFLFKTSLNKNMSVKKEYGNRSKCVIVKLPHKTTKGEISVYEYYNTRYEV